MKRLITLAVLMIIILAGGGLTAQLIANNNTTPLPILTQSENPEASVTQVQDWQADQFFLMVGFILFNLVGIAVTLAVIFWFLDRGVRVSKAEAAQKAALTASEDGSQ